MKFLFIIPLLIPAILFAQEEKNNEKKRLSFLTGTSQGISFMYKEAKSNTTDKIFEATPCYTFSYGGGISIASKSGKAFSEIIVNYRSYSNVIKEIVDINSTAGYSSKTSYNRFNYLTLDYRCSRYVKIIRDFNTFFSVGIQASYILNEKKKLNYENSSEVIKTKGKNISDNLVIPTFPTLLLSYGLEFNKGIMKMGQKSRLNIDFTYDTFLFGIISSPSNQYFSTMVNYRILF